LNHLITRGPLSPPAVQHLLRDRSLPRAADQIAALAGIRHGRAAPAKRLHDTVDHERIALVIERGAEAGVNRRALDRAERIRRLASGGWTRIRLTDTRPGVG